MASAWLRKMMPNDVGSLRRSSLSGAVSRLPKRKPVDIAPPQCRICNDKGWKTRIDASGYKFVEPCTCRSEALKRALIERAAVPRKFLSKGFDDFVTKSPNPRERLCLERAVRSARNWCRSFRDTDGVTTSKGLIFVGPPGGGKSHLAAACLQAVVGHYRVRGRFCNFTQFIRRMHRSYSKDAAETSDSIMRPIVEADLVLIDEIGRERPTDHTLDLMHSMIEDRYLRSAPTLFTTNYPLTGRGTILAHRMSDALVSRIWEMTTCVDMTDAWDFRQQVLAHST